MSRRKPDNIQDLLMLPSELVPRDRGVFSKCDSFSITYKKIALKKWTLVGIFWFCMVILACITSMSISYSHWTRYSANPTVVSIKKDFRNWENPFPAVTGCYQDKMDEEKADKYILENWRTNSSDSRYPYYVKLIQTITNISYANLQDFHQFSQDSSLQNINMFDIALKVHPQISGTLVTFDSKSETNWTLVMTEMGICFSMNSKFSGSLAVMRGSTNNDDAKILRCHYLNGLCYARYDSEPQLPLKYYVHSYLDIIHATSEPPLSLAESEELEINYRMQESDSSISLRSLRPSQRGCRFPDEPLTEDATFYSMGMCYMVCRYELALKFCGCRPFFYNHFGGKVCDLAGLACLSKYADNISSAAVKKGCDCPQPCHFIKYYAELPKLTKWEFGYFDQRITFRWGLLPPTTKYHRDVIFGFVDLVVAFGGSLSLLLGFSFISGIENAFLIVEGYLIARKKFRRTSSDVAENRNTEVKFPSARKNYITKTGYHKSSVQKIRGSQAVHFGGRITRRLEA